MAGAKIKIMIKKEKKMCVLSFRGLIDYALLIAPNG